MPRTPSSISSKIFIQCSRFSATIAGEFNGHTHSDEFKIFYGVEDGAPAALAWGAGSATAYTHYNLNYKIATFHPATFVSCTF